MASPTTLVTFLADHEFLAGCYLLTVSIIGVLFSHSAVVGFPHLIDSYIDTITLHSVTLTFTVRLKLGSVMVN